MRFILTEICEGRGKPSDIELLEDLCAVQADVSLCALGKTAPNPVLSTLKYFREEVMAHVVDKHCPTGNCDALMPYSIIPEKCKSCGLCVKKCPVEAITGQKGVPYVINPDLCIKCGACLEACSKFGAIIKGKGE